MALIGRLFALLFGFLFACLAAGMIVVGAVLYPEFSDLGAGPIDQSAINVVLGFGFIFISGFALLPAMIVVLITEAFYIRSVLTYAVGGAIVGCACYLGLIPFDPATLHFDGIVRRVCWTFKAACVWAALVHRLVPAPPAPPAWSPGGPGAAPQVVLVAGHGRSGGMGGLVGIHGRSREPSHPP